MEDGGRVGSHMSFFFYHYSAKVIVDAKTISLRLRQGIKRGCSGSSESIHVKLPHCWKSHVTAHLS